MARAIGEHSPATILQPYAGKADLILTSPPPLLPPVPPLLLRMAARSFPCGCSVRLNVYDIDAPGHERFHSVADMEFRQRCGLHKGVPHLAVINPLYRVSVPNGIAGWSWVRVPEDSQRMSGEHALPVEFHYFNIEVWRDFVIDSRKPAVARVTQPKLL